METNAPAAPSRRAPAWLMAGLLGLMIVGGIAWLSSASGSNADSPAEPVLKVAKLDYVVKDMDGKDVNLADYKGRPLLLNFWATYCGPCKTEIPIFVEMVEKYREQKLAILGISIDDSPADLRPFAAEFKMNYPVLVGLGHDDLLETYDAVFLIPITWFVKPDGTIHLKHPGSATREWFDEQIRALLPPGADRP
jgi:thiol-disulfide isomerase/thioredoxin